MVDLSLDIGSTILASLALIWGLIQAHETFFLLLRVLFHWVWTMYKCADLYPKERSWKPVSIVVHKIKVWPSEIIRTNIDKKVQCRKWLIGLCNSSATDIDGFSNNSITRQNVRRLNDIVCEWFNKEPKGNITIVGTAFCPRAYDRFKFPKLVVDKDVLLEYLVRYSTLAISEIQITESFNIVIPVQSGWVRLRSHPSRDWVVLGSFEEFSENVSIPKYRIVRNGLEAITSCDSNSAIERISLGKNGSEDSKITAITREEMIQIIIKLQRRARLKTNKVGKPSIKDKEDNLRIQVKAVRSYVENMAFSEFANDVASARTMNDLIVHMMPLENGLYFPDNVRESEESFIKYAIALDAFIKHGFLIPNWYHRSHWVGIKEVWME